MTGPALAVADMPVQQGVQTMHGNGHRNGNGHHTNGDGHADPLLPFLLSRETCSG